VTNYSFVILTRPKAGREDEWATWHERHVQDVLRSPGFMSCRRLRVLEPQPSGREPEWIFMTIYELVTDDISGCISELRRRVETNALPTCKASDPSKMVSLVCHTLSKHIAAERA
jgi:hypothetical protein